jgi:PAS domain S-box-containing protein
MSVDISGISSRLDLLYLVTREFNAGLEINQVLYNVLSATVAAVGASDATLFLFDNRGRLENSLLISGFEIKKQSQATLATLIQTGLVGWVWQHQQGVVINDTGADERWSSDELHAKLFKVGSAVCVPIHLPNRLIGVLTITAPQSNHFNENDLSLLTVIAGQAAIAIANARLFEAEQQRRQLADTLTSIAHTINSSLDLDEVLALILEQLRLVVDYNSSSILLFEDDNSMLVVRAARGFENKRDALNLKIPFNENGPDYRAILQKKPIAIGDVRNEPYWVDSPSSAKIRSWIGAPLIARDEAVGILTVDSYEVDKYSEENVNVVAVFAEQAATAVANAQAVTRLQNAEATYAALFEDSTDMIFITNYDGLILDINRKACQMLRRHKDVFINSNITLIAPQLKDFLVKESRRLKVWREASIELEIKDAYRQLLSLEIKVRQIQFKGKDAVEWVGRDISARKEVERMRQDMVNMLIHDLRGPLGNILNTIDLIAMMLDMGASIDNTKIVNFLDMARRSGQTIKDLVDSVLDVSRLEQGEIPLQRSLTNLPELVQSVEDQTLPQAMAKEMELIIHPVPDTAAVWLDSSLIRRVLINLVGNAIKYTASQGRIALTTDLTKDTLHFAVSDNGPGISKADQAHIFDKFSRVDNSENAPSGVGLGLAFCKLAVEAHDGVISVDSTGIPGQGSTFHVTLPIIEAPDSTENHF